MPSPPVTVVHVGADARADATLAAVSGALAAEGASLATERVADPGPVEGGLVDLVDGGVAFRHTPAALVRSWRTARLVEGSIRSGARLLLSDRGGTAGVLALEEAARPGDERRQVILAAGDSETLALLEVGGTLDDLPDEIAQVVDWELVAYRFARRVVAPSPRAVELLGRIGVAAQLAAAPRAGAGDLRPLPPHPASIVVPEAVSRVARTPAILRALNGAADALGDARVLLSDADVADRIWPGTTWEAMAGVRATLGGRLARGSVEEVGSADIVILGDPFAPPPPVVARLRERGAAVLVAAGSAAAVAYPDAPTWAEEGELAALLAGGTPRRRAPVPPTPPSPGSAPDPGRARRVSVAVPVFRDVRFLADCMATLLTQEQPAHEILLVDDGSRSEEVTAALRYWRERAPGIVRVLVQPNLGVCAARNLAIEEMTGDAFVLVDQDDELDPSFLRLTAAALRADTALTAVSTWTEFFGTYTGVEAKPPFDRRVGLRENPIVSTCALVDLGVREWGVRFEPDLAWLYCEDWDLWAQIVAAGGAFGLVPRPLARHRVHPSSGGHGRTDLALRLGRARATARLRG